MVRTASTRRWALTGAMVAGAIAAACMAGAVAHADGAAPGAVANLQQHIVASSQMSPAPNGPTLNTNPTGITAPVGQYIADAITWAWGILGSVVAAWLVTKVPKQFQAYVTQQALEKYGSLAIAQVAGAVKGWTMSVDVKNAVVSQIVTTLEHYEPDLAKKAGAQLDPLIVSWLSSHGMMPPDANVVPGAAPVAADVKAHNESMAAREPALKDNPDSDLPLKG